MDIFDSIYTEFDDGNHPPPDDHLVNISDEFVCLDANRTGDVLFSSTSSPPENNDGPGEGLQNFETADCFAFASDVYMSDNTPLANDVFFWDNNNINVKDSKLAKEEPVKPALSQSTVPTISVPRLRLSSSIILSESLSKRETVTMKAIPVCTKSPIQSPSHSLKLKSKKLTAVPKVYISNSVSSTVSIGTSILVKQKKSLKRNRESLLAGSFVQSSSITHAEETFASTDCFLLDHDYCTEFKSTIQKPSVVSTVQDPVGNTGLTGDLFEHDDAVDDLQQFFSEISPDNVIMDELPNTIADLISRENSNSGSPQFCDYGDCLLLLYCF